MKLTGQQYIGFQISGKGNRYFNSVNPKNNTILEPKITEAATDEIEEACQLAAKAFQKYCNTNKVKIAAFLNEIAVELEKIRDELISICKTETGLTRIRLNGELTRTVNQIYLFSVLVKSGQYLDVRIDTAIPNRQPNPKPDIRQTQIPIGPVAVFGASNFPLAFSVAGGDTISALAAGCPVIVKANPSHPQTSEIAAWAIINAAKKTNMPEGVFSMLQSKNYKTSIQLVTNSQIKAVGFTGSFKGGKAIYKAATGRTEPIPVYAEMGSVNPIFLLPDSLQKNAKQISEGFINSVTLGAGQFCTNPGLFFSINSSERNKFIDYLKRAFKESTGEVMLNEKISNNYNLIVSQSAKIKGVKLLSMGNTIASKCASKPVLLETDYASYIQQIDLKNEIFGPATLGINLENKEELFKAATGLDGQLTISVFATSKDKKDFAELFQIIKNKAGRLILNGFPTGVEVCPSMHHGGPFPATTDVRSTSVGTAAIKRFLRPVAYQNYNEELLPEELKNSNPLKIFRLVNGKLTNQPI